MGSLISDPGSGSTSVYVQHSSSIAIYLIRRYASIEAAVSGVARSGRLPRAEVRRALLDGGSVGVGAESWRAVEIGEMSRRSGPYSRAVLAMRAGVDIPDDALPARAD